MYKFIKEHRISQCTYEFVKKLENKYRVSFPVELINFHLEYDNDIFQSCYFDINNQTFDVRKLYPFCCSEGLSFEVVNDDVRKNELIGHVFYSFAMDNGGNDYYWNSDDNKIYYIPWDDIFTPRLICNSLKEFLDMFKE